MLRFSKITLLSVLVLFISCNNYQKLPDGAVFPLDYKDKTGSFLRIMTWNVEHFVDEHNDPYIHHKREDYSTVSDEKIELFVQALKTADADVVVLQEFESAAFLEEFAATHLPDMNYRFFADYRSRDWYMNVVLMSRVPLGVMHGYGNVYTPVKYQDDRGRTQKETQQKINTRMWSCELWPTPSKPLIITGLHLKAGQSPRDIATRMGQIEFLNHQHDRFARENRNARIAVVGDLNAEPNSEELTKLKTDSRKNTFHDLLGDTIGTHTSDNPSRRLDYILVNDNLKKLYKSGSAEVPYFYKPDKMRKISDHLPVYADFYFKNQ